MKKRLFSLFLAMLMVVTILPTGILAANEEQSNVVSTETEITPVPSTKNQMAYVPSVTLDGKNTDNEYGDAYTVQINIGGTGNPAEDGDRYRVVYTDDAIYVLIEAYDTTFNHKYAYNYTGVSIPAEGSKGDNIEFYFKIGDTFIGSKQRFRDSNPAVNNYGGTKTWDHSNSSFIDYHATRNGMTTTNGYAYEMKFPISELSEAEQEAFKNGTLDVRFSVLLRDGANTYHMDNWEANKFWNGASYVKYYNQFTFKAKELCTDYTKKEAVYQDAVVLDGKNTLGEYDESGLILLNRMNRTAYDDKDGYKVVYTSEGIYVYIENYDSTFDNRYNRNGVAGLGTGADYIDLYFKVGETFAGHKQRYRDSDPAAENYGGLKLWDKANGAQSEFNSTVDGKIVTTGFAYEVFFPVSEMSDADKIAYQNGTLDVRFAVMLQDYSGDYVSDCASALSLWNGVSYVQYYTKFTFDEPKEDFEIHLLGRDMKYSESGKLDGKNTNGEYDGAYVNYICIGGKGDDGAGDIYRVMYTDEAIYVLVEVVDDTVEYYYERTVGGVHYDGLSSNADNIQLYFRIGESFIGSKQHYRDSWNPIQDFGSAVNMREGYGKWDDETGWIVCINYKEDGLTMEMRFPVDKMTEEDQIKFKNHTLDVGFGVMVRNGAGTYHMDCKEALYFWNGAAYVSQYPTFKFRPYILEGGSDDTDEEPVSIKNKIDLKHTAVLFDDNYKGAQMRYTIGDSIVAYVDGVLVSEAAEEYLFCYSVSPLYMNEKVTVELVKDGVVLKKIDSYVMVDYCLGLLEKSAEELDISANEYEFMKVMVEATLGLGNATENAKGEDPVFGAVSKPLVDSADETFDVEILESGVFFDGEQINKMYVKFTTENVDKLTVGFATASLRYVATLEILPVDGEQDTYVVITPVIDATNFDDDYIISFSYAEDAYTRTTVHKITCNVNAGLAALAASENIAVAALAEATYNYAVAVRFYKAS